jgi:hypothetical protein
MLGGGGGMMGGGGRQIGGAEGEHGCIAGAGYTWCANGIHGAVVPVGRRILLAPLLDEPPPQARPTCNPIFPYQRPRREAPRDRIMRRRPAFCG